MHKNQLRRKLVGILLLIFFLSIVFGELAKYINIYVDENLRFFISAVPKFILLFILYLLIRNSPIFDLKKILKRPYISAVAVLFLAISIYFTRQNIGTHYSLLEVTGYYLHTLSTGLLEETAIRWIVFGLLLAIFTPQKIAKSLWIASLLFGVLHISNFIKGKHDIYSTLLQVELAIILGVFFQLLFIKYQNILLIAILHGLANFYGMYTSNFNITNSVEIENIPAYMEFLQSQLSVLIFAILLIPVPYFFIIPKAKASSLYNLETEEN